MDRLVFLTQRWPKPGFAVLLVALSAAFAAWGAHFSLGQRALAADASPPLSYVGSETCGACHQDAYKAWVGSHHQLAMAHADEKNVIGDFNDARFEHFGVKSRFYKRDGKFFVETDGTDGKLAEYEIKYTFGLYPLQQYLIPFPDGRVQALSIAWDSRPKEKGGQRWFPLYPNEPIGAADPLHWTKLNQNWNFMCAECHSTGVRKNYDAAKNTFATTWKEISVGCETCHGQGSAHVAWAHAHEGWKDFDKADSKGLIVNFDERENVGWTHDAATGNVTRKNSPPTLRKEVETCGLCHARRAQISEDWVPGHWLSDTHFVSPLSHGLYFADGQMEDEVYNYGSFKQSLMFANGVTCSDCHDSHSSKLRLPGDGVCLQCHTAAKYETVAHRRHDGVDPPVGCPACHMPARTYMVVDVRHDHSFRIPRPDQSVALATLNACTACHADKSPQWAADRIAEWHGPDRKGFQKFGPAFHAAWMGQADAERLLAAVVSDKQTSGFARSGALPELAPYLTDANVRLAQQSLADPDPMVRIGALDMLGPAPAEAVWPIAASALGDPVLGVRVRAADLLAALPVSRQPEADRAAFQRAADEFVTAQKLNADRPEARLTLGSFYARQGRAAEAEAEYRAALRLAPEFAPAAVNLADLYRQTGREAEGVGVLKEALARSPKDAGLHYALGLARVRQKQLPAALSELREAAALAPDNPHSAYVYAVALDSAGQPGPAMRTLADALAKHPENREILTALVQISQKANDLSAALFYAEKLQAIAPEDADLRSYVERLRQAAKAAGQ